MRAVGELWPEADRQRCTVHRLKNILAKLPQRPALHKEIRQAYWAALDDAENGADAEQRLRALVGRLEPQFPSAAACLADDLPALCTHLRYPLSLRRRLRSTNLLERSLEEVCRRTKVMGRFPGETSCLSLCWAVLDLVISAAHGLGLSDIERQQLLHLGAARAVAPPASLTA
jgi:transposase-like protein